MNDPDQTRSQWLDAADWFAKGDEDIRATDLLLSADPPLIDLAAFHCQQAAEKLIKALLVAAAARVPRIHDLEALSSLASPYYPQLALQMREFGPATAWLARSRYPSGLTDGVGVDGQEVVDILASIKAFRLEASALAPFPV